MANPIYPDNSSRGSGTTNPQYSQAAGKWYDANTPAGQAALALNANTSITKDPSGGTTTTVHKEGSYLPDTSTWRAPEGSAGTVLMQSLTGGTSWDDYINALMAGIGKNQPQIDAFTQARSDALKKLQDINTQDLRGVADTDQAALVAALGRREGAASQSIQSSQAAAQALGPAADQRRQEALTDVSGRQTTAMGDFQNMTAADLQSSRGSITQGMQQQTQDIINGAAQRGLNADSPEVQQQIAQVRSSASNQLGQMAASIGSQYNKQRADLTLSYDNLSSQIRTTEDQYTGLAQSQGAQLQTQLAQIDTSLRMSAQQEERLASQAKEQLYTAADQLAVNVGLGISDMIKNWDIFLDPYAQIIGFAASMSQQMKDLNTASIAGYNETAAAMGMGAHANYDPLGGYSLTGGQAEPVVGGSTQTASNTGFDPNAPYQGYPNYNAFVNAWNQGKAPGSAGGYSGRGDISAAMGGNQGSGGSARYSL